MESHIGEPISLADLASVAALSPYHFSRTFKRCAGISPIRYILKRRVSAAKKMLESTDARHADIAYACGFASQSHFCTSFKLVTGMTAAAWRRAYAKVVTGFASMFGGTEFALPLLI